MITLRYQTFRLVGTCSGLLVILAFVLGIVVQAPWAGFVSMALIWLGLAISVGMGLAVALLRKLGRLEFIYTEKDRNSYIYNMGRQHELMRDVRKARRRKER